MITGHGYCVIVLLDWNSQKDRETNIAAIIEGIVDMIVATDMMARRIDIDGIKNLVNYEVLAEIGTDLQHVGRTERAGTVGIGTSFVTPDDRMIMDDLVKLL
jgi:superfamily II DNA/RNA helicase